MPSCGTIVVFYVDPVPQGPNKIPGGANGSADISIAFNVHTAAGYYICRSLPGGGIAVIPYWHPDSTLGAFTSASESNEARIIDRDPSAQYGRIAVQPYTGMVSVVYSKNDPTTGIAQIFEQRSFDYGRTFQLRGPLVTAINGLKYARLVFYGHAGGKLLLYNDQITLDTSGNPTGQGRIQVLAFDGLDTQTGPFPADGKGIGNLVADDCSFEAIYVQDASTWVDCIFSSGQIQYVYRTHDNGVTWSKVSALSG